MHVPTLLTLMNMYTNNFLDYPHNNMPKVIDGLRSPIGNDFQNMFDFIIVGSGYTGSFLARRLASNGCNNVLVVESGGMPNYDSSIPFLSMGDKDGGRSYFTVPQKYAAKAMIDDKIMLSLPKNLGQIDHSDHGIYIPADLSDFHRWAYTYQLPGWSYNDMKKYAFTVSSSNSILQTKFQRFFNRSSNSSVLGQRGTSLFDDITLIDEKLTDGFRDNILEPLKYAWLRTAKQMDQPTRSGEEQEIFTQGGFFVPKTLARNGSRINPATLYLNGMEEGIMILCHVVADKIIFDSSGNTVLGLQLKDENTGYTVEIKARKHVILTSGAIGTAQLLLQSGIGPSDVLKKERIQVLHDLPVGLRLNDRIKASLFVKVDSVAMELIKAELNDPMQLYRYLETRAGIMANTSIIGVAFLKSKVAGPGIVDLMIEVKPSGLMGVGHVMATMNLATEMAKHIDSDGTLNRQIGLEVTITLLKPFSQGTMWVWRMSNDTFAPRVNPAYLSDRRDLGALVSGARFVEKLLRSEFMRDLGARLIYPSFPNCTGEDVWAVKGSSLQQAFPTSDRYWRCVFQHIATTGHHITSTVPLGHVVNSRLSIKNVKGLKICDESIFPEPPSGGFAATMLTLANRCAQVLQEDLDVSCEA